MGKLTAFLSAALLAAASLSSNANAASNFDISRSWANLSPYRDAPGFGLPKGVPASCELSQVHVLHRHAQRMPTSLEATFLKELAHKISKFTAATRPGNASSAVFQGPFAFLNDWEYLLGTDLLLEPGAATEATSGARFWSQYGRLLYRAGPAVPGWEQGLNAFPNGTARPKPVFRTTSQSRIKESARWWLSGFFGNTGANSSYENYNLVVIPETSKFNNTLAPNGACTEKPPIKPIMEYLSRYTKNTISRLSPLLPDSFNLTAEEVMGMQSLCAYETAALDASSFCSLFTEQEWRDFNYFYGLTMYSTNGFGAPNGRAQGIGYVLELAARLRGELIPSSDTSINSSYDNNSAQFPLGQPFYMDMSHDSVIIAVLTALGLRHFRYNSTHGLPGNVNHAINTTFQLPQVTPFGARLVSEIWTCPRAHHPADGQRAVLYSNPDSLANGTAKTRYIRFLLNEAPLPLDGLPGCESSARAGFCPVSDFLNAVPSLKEDAMYQYACFGNYSTGGEVGNGQPPQA